MDVINKIVKDFMRKNVECQVQKRRTYLCMYSLLSKVLFVLIYLHLLKIP